MTASLLSGEIKIHSLLASGTPSVKVSEDNFPICLGGKFTIPSTSFPINWSLVYRTTRAPEAFLPTSSPKLIMSLCVVYFAFGNFSTSTILPTRISSFWKSSNVAIMLLLYLFKNEARKTFTILPLQVFFLPILARYYFAAISRTAITFHSVVVVINHRVINGQLLTLLNVAHCYKSYFTPDANVGIARMIKKYHHFLDFVFCKRRENKIVGNLQIRLTNQFFVLLKCFPINNMAALNCYYFSLFDWFYCKKTTAFDFASCALFCLGRNVSRYIHKIKNFL